MKMGIITEIEGKIPSISGLVTNYVLTEVGNKEHDVSSLVKKQNKTKKATNTEYNTKISEIENNVSDHDHMNTLLLQNLIS